MFSGEHLLAILGCFCSRPWQAPCFFPLPLFWCLGRIHYPLFLLWLFPTVWSSYLVGLFRFRGFKNIQNYTTNTVTVFWKVPQEELLITEAWYITSRPEEKNYVNICFQSHLLPKPADLGDLGGVLWGDHDIVQSLLIFSLHLSSTGETVPTSPSLELPHLSFSLSRSFPGTTHRLALCCLRSFWNELPAPG